MVRNSLRYDIVQPHRDETLGNNSDGTTLVLVLAVSGGCDSMALFHSILSLTTICEDGGVGNGKVYNDNSRRWLHLGIDNTHPEPHLYRVPCELHVAHFNHEQRGEISDGDCDFVRDRCIEHEVPFYSYTWSDMEESCANTEVSTGYQRDDDHNKELDDNRGFSQDVARRWRQRKLKDLLSSLVITPNAISNPDTRWGTILTAHHRDDADETIMLKLLRGSHLTNLWSMKARSDGFNLQLECDKTSIGYFAKPMLELRKSQIIEYLTSNSLEWREDDSNSSSKYKRNMVRNELMPLLSELAGGDNALRVRVALNGCKYHFSQVRDILTSQVLLLLQKRLINLENQSREISQFLSDRSHDYLRSMISDTKFILQRDSTNEQFDLVQENALHLWIMKTTLGKLQVSYDQMLRIRDQIQNYPDNLQWKMDLGSHWEIRRNGDTLVVVEGNEKDQPSKSGILPWIVIAGPGIDMNDYEDVSDVQETVELRFGPLPNNLGHSTVHVVQVKDCAGMQFTPPWRIGRSAMKLKDFLRGQKVPLHRRDESIVLCLSDDDSSRHALAVHIEGPTEDSSGTWIVNSNFCPRDDLPITKVVLGKTPKHPTLTPHNI